MKPTSENVNITITDCTVSFDSVYSASTTPQEYIEEIKQANVLFLPDENRYDEDGVHFPETASEMFQYFRDKATGNMNVNIAISDTEFQMLEKHADIIEIVKLIVDSTVFNIVIGLITNFIYDKLKKEHKNPDEVNAKLEIIVEDRKAKTSKKISYEGPSSEIQNVLNTTNLIANGSKDDQNN